MPCVEICSDHVVRIETRTKRNIHRNWIMMQNPLAKWAPGSGFFHYFAFENPGVTYLVIHLCLSVPKAKVGTYSGQVIFHVYMGSISLHILVVVSLFVLALALLVCWLQCLANCNDPVLWAPGGTRCPSEAVADTMRYYMAISSNFNVGCRFIRLLQRRGIFLSVMGALF